MYEKGGDSSWWDVLYTYNQWGQVASVTYPASQVTGAQTLTTGFDNMGRPNSLADSLGNHPVSAVAYNPANQPTFSAPGVSYTDSRGYNALNQLTTLTNSSGAGVNVIYNYDSSHNNGQIVSMADIIPCAN
jgi:YD repeat-containing protein